MIEIMTIEEISQGLGQLDRKKVAKETGLSYRLLQQFAKGEKSNTTLKTLEILRNYFKDENNE